MASPNMSLKLLIDTEKNKVIFAEAGKDFVDFLFHLLTLPVGTVIRLLAGQNMVGCLENLYDSLKNLDDSYMQTNQNKETLLKPHVPPAALVPLLLTEEASAPKTLYTCRFSHRYVADDQRAFCPQCSNYLNAQMTYVSTAAAAAKDGSSGEGGFVKGVVTYMIMDDLVVTPMSTISGITQLNKFNVSKVGALKEKVVTFGMDEAVKLLKASLEIKTVLTSVFLSNMGAEYHGKKIWKLFCFANK